MVSYEGATKGELRRVKRNQERRRQCVVFQSEAKNGGAVNLESGGKG